MELILLFAVIMVATATIGGMATVIRQKSAIIEKQRKLFNEHVECFEEMRTNKDSAIETLRKIICNQEKMLSIQKEIITILKEKDN